jgi:hypothetical protein
LIRFILALLITMAIWATAIYSTGGDRKPAPWHLDVTKNEVRP